MTLYSPQSCNQTLSGGDPERMHVYSVVPTNTAVTFANSGPGHRVDWMIRQCLCMAGYMSFTDSVAFDLGCAGRAVLPYAVLPQSLCSKFDISGRLVGGCLPLR